MLLSEEAEHRVKGIMDAVGGAIATYLIGRDLGQTRGQALAGALGIRQTTSLEQSYLAGKAASLIGAKDLKQLPAEELEAILRNHDLSLSPAEQAQLKSLRDDTARWIEGRTANWKQTFNKVLARADQQWRGEVAKAPIADALTHSTTRHSALTELADTLRSESAIYAHDVDRLLQTETHKYFQQGQASVWQPDQTVYKLPRRGACPECMRLHLNQDGSPKLYQLKDIAGNTNVGAKAVDWEFTIGPTHPWCYCTLHVVEEGEENPGADDTRAEHRKEALRKALPTPEDTETLATLRKAFDHEHGDLEPHHRVLLDAIKELYGTGDQEPPC